MQIYIIHNLIVWKSKSRNRLFSFTFYDKLIDIDLFFWYTENIGEVMKKNILIIGAGPAGLTAAYYLLKKTNEYNVLVLEMDKQVGGISKTICYDGNRMDLGGHRFFTKNKKVMDLWTEILPLSKNENEEKILIERPRLSRIYYNKKFFDYPVNLSFKTIKNLGLKDTVISGFSYLKSIFHKLPEDNLENFYINRFGKRLYEIFFRDYTEKLWGINPREIDSSWGSQRVKGVSINAVLKDYFQRLFKIKNENKEISLIDKFYYPKYGPGLMYEEMAKKIIKMGGIIKLNAEVISIKKNNNKIVSILYKEKSLVKKIEVDYLISSMPVKDLINVMNGVPKSINNVSRKLPYRDFVTIGIILDKIKLKNNTKFNTYNNIVPDTWIYVQSKDVKLGRIQVFNNWSPYLVNDKNTISLGLEYFCNENDKFWNMSNEKLKDFAYKELLNMEIIDNNCNILNYHVEKVKKAYPAYFGSYKKFNDVKDYLNRIENLYCIGRNGMHRYNNMDHSMETAFVCVDNILKNIKTKDNIWNVNTESSYHEVINNEKNN